MQNFKSVLQIIYYCIWIPLGALLFIVLIFLIINNPLRGLGGMMGPGGGGPGGGFGGPGGGGFQGGGSQGEMPSKEMMEKFMKQGGQGNPK